MDKRKIIIGSITFAVMLATFLIYNSFVDTPDIGIDEGLAGGNGVETPDFNSDAGKIGNSTKLAPVDIAEFKTYDEQSHALIRVFGFEKLLNPSSGTDIWRLQAPYMRVFESKFKCDIKSKRGNVRIERVGNSPNPVSAELTEDVEIIIQMREDNKQIKINLDDLTYDNERSAFSTKGPVKLTSENGVMEGVGMEMLYDAEMGKLAYLEITELKYLLLKNVVAPEGGEKDAAEKPAVVSPQKQVADAVPVAGNVPHDTAPVAVVKENAGAIEKEPVAEEKFKYYQCTLDKDVNIEYGKKIVIVGADEVMISNILWAQDDSAEKKKEDRKAQDTVSTAKPEDNSSNAASAEPAVAVTTDSSAVQPAVASEPKSVEPQEHGLRDVYVTCKGSLIITPMGKAGMKPHPMAIDNRRKMEIKGNPVKVGQFDKQGTGNIETIASCGKMTYDIDNEVLDLGRGGMEDFVELNMGNDEANISTEGSVRWMRKANHASIIGPGVLLVSEKQNGGGSSNMKFDGVMDVYFADNAVGASANELSLSTVNLAGGMVASINKEGKTTVVSDDAKFTFEGGRNITTADLDGNVSFKSNSGNMQSNSAKILFAKNDVGKTVPVSLAGTGDAVLEPSQIKGDRPVRFHAKRIDFDMLTNVAIASGPVEFMFYPPSTSKDKAENKDQKPVVITAKKDAKYFPKEKQVVFNGDVVGTKLTTENGITQRDEFYGEQLIVDIGESQDGSGKDDIKHVRVDGGVVQLHSERKVDDVIIGNVLMSCQQLDWQNSSNMIVANGPGSIEINNSKAPEQPNKEEKDRSFALAGPCVATIDGFKVLVWDMKRNQIEADGGARSVTIRYMPFKDGKIGQVVKAAAGHISSKLVATEGGRFDLDWIKTRDGIIYEEQGRLNIMGDKMDYNGQTGLMVIEGSKGIPCTINGKTRLQYVEYNMKTGEITSQLGR